MGHQNNKEMDVESLQKSGRRRGRCLDTCLVISVIFLFAAVSAVAAGVVLAFKDLQSKVQPSRPPLPFHKSPLTLDAPDSAYKMQNFAYLEASSSLLANYTMPLAAVHYGAGTSVGSNFLFDPDQHSLQVKQEGMYFMYVDLNLTCRHRCAAGVLSVHLSDKLTCQVELPAVADSKPVTRKCWTVSQMDTKARLLSQMTVRLYDSSPKVELKWKLELRGSGFGMFLVD